MTAVTVKLGRDDTAWTSITDGTCAGQGTELVAGASRQCTTTVMPAALVSADTTAKSVAVRAGATVTGGPNAAQTVLILKLGALQVILTNKTRTGTTSGTVPITIEIVNTGPVDVTGVTLQLPTNLTLAANSTCATAFTVPTTATNTARFSCLDAIYAITPQLADGPNNEVSLTVTANSADLMNPATTTKSVNLGRSALLSITTDLIGVINKTGRCSSNAVHLLAV